jgi:hypothetical protein
MQKGVLTGVILLAVAIVSGLTVAAAKKREDPWRDKNFLEVGKDLPIAWVYYDESDVNSRWWQDWGARSSRVLNVPYLNMCYETILKATAGKYRVEVIGGLADLAAKLGGWELMPTPLQNRLAAVGEAELNWIRAAVLAKWGGLWIAPSTIWLQPVGELPKDKTVFFGMDDETPYSDRNLGTGTPGLRVVWSPKAGDPLWTEWETTARARLEKAGGGRQIRHDDYSDAAVAIKRHAANIELRPTAERSRTGPAGKRIQLEDLLASGAIPFDVTSTDVYVPVAWPELRDRRAFGWFIRSSEEQIMESPLAITALFKKALA